MGIIFLNLVVFVRNFLCFRGCDKVGLYFKYLMTFIIYFLENIISKRVVRFKRKMFLIILYKWCSFLVFFKFLYI